MWLGFTSNMLCESLILPCAKTLSLWRGPSFFNCLNFERVCHLLWSIFCGKTAETTETIASSELLVHATLTSPTHMIWSTIFSQPGPNMFDWYDRVQCSRSKGWNDATYDTSHPWSHTSDAWPQQLNREPQGTNALQSLAVHPFDVCCLHEDNLRIGKTAVAWRLLTPTGIRILTSMNLVLP